MWLHHVLQPLASLLLVATAACQPNTSRSDDPTSPARRGDAETVRRDTTVMSLQILPLQDPHGTFVSVDRDGLLTRLEGRNLTLTRAGSARLAASEVATLFDLAARVPRVQRMGDGIVEGTIYRLASGGDTVAAFVESFVPDELRRLLDRLGPHLERTELHANTGWYLAAEPVAASRRSKLAASGSPVIDPAALSAGAREAVLAASTSPFVLRPIPRALADELAAAGAGREPFVAADDARWIQLGIWGPP